MAVDLFDWQRPTADRLVEIFKRTDVALNASETGTGKTYVACETLRRLKRPALVVSPKSVITAWHKVAEDMGIGDLILGVLNPERLALGKSEYYQKNRWLLPVGSMVVWDEVHRGASGPNTLTTRAMADLKVFHIPVLAQSATIADSPLKMRAIGFLLGLHHFNVGSYYGWCRQNGCFSIPYVNGLMFPKGPKGAEYMGRIHAAISDRMVRIRINDVPDFPETFVQSQLFDLDESYTDEINAIYEEMDVRLKEPASNSLTELMRARQRTELIKVPLLSDLCSDALEQDKSVVIFVSFTETVHQLMDVMAGKKVPAVFITGEQTQKQRDEAIARFQNNDAYVCVANSQAGGVGVNLHDVRQERPRVSYLTPSWSAVDMLQCLGRIHRAGGSKTIQTFVLVANTIEEKIHRAIQRKLCNIQRLNDGDLT